jgi:chorismate mutase
MMDQEAGIKALAEYRDQIDAVDRELVRLLNERTKIVEQLGRVKSELAMPVYEPKREDQVYANIVDTNKGPLPADALKRLFERIVDEMRTLQKMKRLQQEKEDGSRG